MRMAWIYYVKYPHRSEKVQKRLHTFSLGAQSLGLAGFRKFSALCAYYDRWLIDTVLVKGTWRVLQRFGSWCWFCDRGLIDTVIVNGTAVWVHMLAVMTRRLQTGYVYHYALWMTMGLLVLLCGVQ
jgi:NADH:ubiquinone oxidoreductase subunit 5 (subunit L)/multisubunit Na+/H+ antiporter MnhA subunit